MLRYYNNAIKFKANVKFISNDLIYARTHDRILLIILHIMYNVKD